MQCFLVQILCPQSRIKDLSNRTNQLDDDPRCDPVGGLKVHSIPFNKCVSSICSKFHPSMARLNSRSAPTKLVPLSDLNSLTCPRLAMKRRNALMQESVSSDEATLTCIALIAKHMKITPYLFTRLLPRLISNGPK